MTPSPLFLVELDLEFERGGFGYYLFSILKIFYNIIILIVFLKNKLIYKGASILICFQ
jgi:hypothetical protein